MSISRRPGVAHFADSIKIVIMLIKPTYKDSLKSEELEVMYQNATFVCTSWHNKSC